MTGRTELPQKTFWDACLEKKNGHDGKRRARILFWVGRKFQSEQAQLS
jgi:hypothetical protein